MPGILFEHWRAGAIIFIREADRAEAETWSINMEEGYGGPSRLSSSPPPRIVASVLARISIPFDRALAAFLYLIRNSFIFSQVEQVFCFEGFHRFDYSLRTGLVSS